MAKEDSAPRRLSISEMAQIHGISRQTLIYYDKIDLFKPDIVEDNGYRFYSVEQIPFLREICFLRSIDMPLNEIRKNNLHNASTTMIELLVEQRDKIDDEIEKLAKQKKEIEKRLNLYKKPSDLTFDPYIQYFPERKVLYCDWNTGSKKSRQEMHTALLKAWNATQDQNILPSSFYGTLYKKADVLNDDPLANVKSVFIINFDDLAKAVDTITLPAGEYVCVQKFGMCYDLSCLRKTIAWIEENGYEIIGDIYEESLLDGSIYESKNEPDFSELQIPIRSI